MSLRSLMVHPVTIVRPGTTVDRYGNVTKDWATGSRQNLKGWVSRRSQLEDRSDGREAEVSDWVVYLPTTATIAGGDRVEWAGVTFEVDGPPLPAWTPRGPHHIEAQLQVVDG